MLRLFRAGGKHTKTIWWALTIVTVVTFVGGFVFVLGARLDTTRSARMSGAVGTVDGASISRQEYQSALNDQRANYRRQFGIEPAERDARIVELQAWRSIITQRVMDRLARREGIRVYDPEIVWSLRTSPPAMLASSPEFQTKGQFDASKYEAALRNPGNNWLPFEEMVRAQLPTRKLQQRMMAAIKISQPELQDEYAYRAERVNATVVAVPPSNDPKLPPPSAADLDRAYQKHKSRFYAGLRVQLELLVAPRRYTDEDLRAAKQLAQSLVERARKGEDFGQLARDYSEGPTAEKGGVIDRPLQPSEFGAMGQHMLTLQPGQISDAFPDGGRFVIFKLLERSPDTGGQPGSMKVAQILLRAHSNEETVREQYQTLVKIRSRAVRIGLGKAAAEKGLATARTRFFDQNSPPEELYTAPGAADWGLRAKLGAVGPIFEGLDEFIIAQVAGRHESGPASRDEAGDLLRQIAELEARVDRAQPKADSLATLLAAGKSLEQAAKVVGLQPMMVPGLTRTQPDPRLATAPEIVGALFAARPGKVVGPVRANTGWYFGRVDGRVPPDSAGFEKAKGQITQEILTRRQQAFFNGFSNEVLEKARVQDLREGGAP